MTRRHRRRPARIRPALAALLLLLAPEPLSGQDAVPLAAEPAPATREATLSAEAAPRLRSEGVDGALQRRLEAIYGNLSALSDVRVEVGTGIVRLSGEAASLEAREQAAAIARRHEGVLAVDNRIRVRRGFAQRLAPARQELLASLDTFLAFLPLLVAGSFVLALFWALSRLAGRWPGPYRRLARSRFAADLLRQVVQTLVFVAGVVLALRVVGATALAGAALGTAGIVGIVIGFAFRDLVENYIASVLLSLRRPFDPGDLVDVDGREGKVVRLTSRATILMTLDGNHLRIPNSQVFKGVLLNYTHNPQRRLHFTVGIAIESDLRAAQHAGEAALRALPGILAEPAPWTAVEEIDGAAASLRYHAWIDQRQTDWYKARSEAVRAVKEALASAGIEGPTPSYRVAVRRDQGAEAVPPPPGAGEAADLAPEHHLDERIAAERETGEDLLERSPTKE